MPKTNGNITTADKSNTKPLTKSQVNGYLDGSSEDEKNITNLISTKTNGIEGLPYQFMESVDCRLPGTDVGRKYAERIFSRLPLLFLTPCEPLFMDDFSKQDQQNLLQGIIGDGIENIAETVSGSGRYYSTTYAYDEYYKYLNTMIASVAIYLGLFNETIQVAGYNEPVKIGQIAWQKEMNSSFATYFSASENIIFYLDGMTSVSETFSNDTTESSLASQINGYSDTAKEIKFLFGDKGNAVADMISKAGDITSSITSQLAKGLSNVGGGIVGSLADKGVYSVLNGGKIVFPEIWSNSSFDRSYSIDIKLRSPDHDSLSILLNVLKPYCKLLTLCLPRQTLTKDGSEDPNSYNSPFLVKAYSKGLFNIDMGIITGLTVTRGAECCWNDDGLPTQIDISVEIKDLYKSLMMSRINDFKNGLNIMKSVANNTSYQDFLANMAGLNIGQMEMGRRIKMYYYLTQTYVGTSTANLYTKVENKISNLVGKLYNIL